MLQGISSYSTNAAVANTAGISYRSRNPQIGNYNKTSLNSKDTVSFTGIFGWKSPKEVRALTAKANKYLSGLGELAKKYAVQLKETKVLKTANKAAQEEIDALRRQVGELSTGKQAAEAQLQSLRGKPITGYFSKASKEEIPGRIMRYLEEEYPIL